MARSISTHVLDVGRGRPAAGITVKLYSGNEMIGQGTTDIDGRITGMGGSDLAPGPYLLQFDLEGYHPSAEHLFESVSLLIELDGGEGNLHLPLLVSPYSVMAYRGS